MLRTKVTTLTIKTDAETIAKMTATYDALRQAAELDRRAQVAAMVRIALAVVGGAK